MLPVNDFIFANPDSASIPIMVVLGVVFLMMLVLSLRHGPGGAREIMEQFRWIFVVAVAGAAAWGLYAYAVLYPPSLWGSGL